MISNINIENFKSIKSQQLTDLKPIIGIWGKNGSGKSSLLQSIVWAAKNNGNVKGNGIDISNFCHKGKCGENNKICLVQITIDGKELTCKYGKAIHPPGIEYTKIRYFPPWRSISSRRSQISRRIETDLGYQANNIHTFIHWFLHRKTSMFLRGDQKAKEEIEKLNYWLKKIGFGDLLDKNYQDTVGGIYVDQHFNVEVDLIDGGFGGNSFLPILLESYSFKDGVLLIEEPEISLHPGAQADVIDFFIEMAKERNHQIIFTSHSLYFLHKIKKYIAKGDLEPEFIALYKTNKNESDGTKFELIDNNEIIERFSEYWLDTLPEIQER